MTRNIEKAIKAHKMEGSLKERCEELMKIEGMMRGELLRSNFVYLRKKEGNLAIERMEKKLEEIGYPLKFEEINSFKWYKDPFCSIFMLSFQSEFGWKEEDIFNLGRFSPQYSLIIKIALRHLLSLRKAFDYAPKLWRRNVDYGVLESYEFSEGKRYMILRLKEYALHPLVCIYIRGYLTSLFEQIYGKDKIKTEEISCIFREGDFHDYKISWR
jgi:hypothetical protein